MKINILKWKSILLIHLYILFTSLGAQTKNVKTNFIDSIHLFSFKSTLFSKNTEKISVIDKLFLKWDTILKVMPIPYIKRARPANTLSEGEGPFYDSINQYILDNGFDRKLGQDTFLNVVRSTHLDLNGTDYCMVNYYDLEKQEIIISAIMQRGACERDITYYFNKKIVATTSQFTCNEQNMYYSLTTYLWKNEILKWEYIGIYETLSSEVNKRGLFLIFKYSESNIKGEIHYP